jgi:translation initiation factor 2 beta subunit (eIF-2beta)/eIF-5
MMTVCCDTLAGDNSAKSTLKERDKMPEHKDQGSSNQGNVRLEIPDVIDRDPRQIVNRLENHKGKQVTVETQKSRKPNHVPLL